MTIQTAERYRREWETSATIAEINGVDRSVTRCRKYLQQKSLQEQQQQNESVLIQIALFGHQILLHQTERSAAHSVVQEAKKRAERDLRRGLGARCPSSNVTPIPCHILSSLPSAHQFKPYDLECVLFWLFHFPVYEYANLQYLSKCAIIDSGQIYEGLEKIVTVTGF